MQPYWGECSAMRPVLAMVERVADSDVTVLITGESGVGKEVIARELHRRSPRAQKKFVKVNCAALPADLLESELFGHERGAFTGAQATRVGKFEFAQRRHDHARRDRRDAGVAPGEAPARARGQHVHASSAAIGPSSSTCASSRRPTASSRHDASGPVPRGLYYRLQVIEIHVPPLRERREEIMPLVEYFLSSTRSATAGP